MKSSFLLFLYFFLIFLKPSCNAQQGYNAVASYGLRKLNPSYSGKAIQVRRSCDNGITDIGFNSCGDLDTNALKAFVMAANPLSAITVTAATAYSLRRLYCNYTGYAIRVRSSGPLNPVFDIGFTANGDLDTVSLKTLIGANSAYVTTWYDQSGNVRNATQASAGNQPRIVNAGVVERQGNMPAVRWLGSGCSLSTAAFTAYSAAACFNGVVKVATDLTYNTIVNKTTNNYPAPLDFYNSQMVIGNGAGYSFYSYGQTLNAALPQSVWTYQAAAGGACNFYYNGGLTASGTVGAFADNGNPLVLGSRADGVTSLNGWLSEIITFDALPSATDRKFLEWGQGQYYSISGLPLTALPVAPASGSVTKWYDQSGTGKDAVQTLTFSQPAIISAGVIEKNNSNPAIYFNGLLTNLVAPLSTSVYPVTMSLLANTSGSTTGGAFLKLGTELNLGQAGIGIGIGNSGGTYLSAGTSVIGLKEWAAWCPSNPNANYPVNPFTSTTIQNAGSGGMLTYLNGTNIPLSNSATAVSGSMSGSLAIGGYVNSVNLFAAMRASETLVFGSALSNTQRALLETNQAAYDNITISNNKYTPPAAGSYCRYVNGIGRESASDSVGGTNSTVGLGFSVGQGASDFLKDDGDYLTAGINCPVQPALSTLNLPGTVVQRWNNDWYLNKTDINSNNGTVTLFFDFSDYGMTGFPGAVANYELMGRNSPAGTFSIVSGTTKSVVGDRVLFSVDASAITNGYYTIGTKNISASTLPVELIDFKASCSHAQVFIKWATATQVRNDHFTVERTLDGIGYETVAVIKGAGTNSSRMDYNCTDPKPWSGTSYYRLKQTDLNGAEKTFKLAQVSCENINNAIRIYPNPSPGVFMISGAPLYTDVNIYTITGERIYTQKNTNTWLPLNLSELPDGIYFISIGSPEAVVMQKMVIRH